MLELGPAHASTLVMLHGLRDTAHALIPLVERHLIEPMRGHPGYRVLILENRGHGDSDRSEAYAMTDFVMDVHGVFEHFVDDTAALFGHSLGGHVATKFAALFPERVEAAIIAEGLGPPTRPHEGNETAEVAAQRHMLLSRLAPSKSRIQPTLDAVAERLMHNNPRLGAQEAHRLAPYLSRPVEGGFEWNFDPRANSVFLTTSSSDNAKFWRHVLCPTCVISGSLAYEYWGSQMAIEGYDGRYGDGEIETRCKNFPVHEHHWFERSGHMIHYDEPDRLGRLMRDFLEKHHV